MNSPKKIAILTDSTCDLSPAQIQGLPVYIVPLRILCSDGEYEDGVTIFSKDIYNYLHVGELPKTSLPAMGRAQETIDRIIADGYDGIVAVMLSSGLSGTYNMVRLLAEDCSIPMQVFDSLSAAIGLGAMVLQLAEDLSRGMSWEELTERRVPQLIRNTHAFFTLDTLEYLRKGGRIGAISATAGALLQIKPILSFVPEDGRLTSVAKVRGNHAVFEKLPELLFTHGEGHHEYNLCITNGGRPEDVAQITAMVQEKLPDCRHLWFSEIGGTLSCYIGDGVLGAVIQVLD